MITNQAGLRGFSALRAVSFAVALAIGQTAVAEDAAKVSAAESQDQELPVVTVTAQRRSENAQDVPVSITAVSADELTSAGITNLQELNTLVPSLNVTNIAGGVSFFVRGVGTASSQVENNVLTYVDDVLIPNQRAVGMDLIDVQQVSVLKGPQGTLFGRNATGGVLQITTRDPTNTPELEVRTGVDNYATWRSDVFAGGPLTDVLKGSLMASYTTQGEGWGYDPIAHYDTWRIADHENVRGKLLFTPSDNFSLKISADLEHNRGTNDIIEVPYTGTALAFEPNVLGPDNYRDSRGDFPNTTRLQSEGVSGDLRADLGFAELRSITAYRTGWHNWQFDADRTPTPAFNIIDDETFSNTTEELQLLSPKSSAFKWVVGGYYFHNVNANSPIVYDFIGPFSPTPTSLGQEVIFGSESAKSYAGFAEGTLEVLPRTNVTLGARYTTETRRLVGSDSGTLNDGTGLQFSLADKSISFNKWSFRAAIDHKFTDDMMAYVSYNRGFRSGGFNISSLSNAPYLPEQLDAVEAGLKTEFLNGRLRVNVDGYHYDYKNIQLISFTSVTVSQIINAAAAEMYGFEGDVEARVTDHFSVVANLSLESSKFTNYPDAVFSNGYSLFPGNATGNRTPFSEPVQASVGLNYRLPSPVGTFEFNATDSYNSSFYFESDNDLRQPAFDYLNLSTTWTLPNNRYSVKLWGTNLLNEQVASTGVTQTLGKIVAYGNPPRLYGITFDAKF